MSSLLSINLGNPSFISTADFLVRGVFLPAVGILCIVMTIKTMHDTKGILNKEEENNDDAESLWEDEINDNAEENIA